MENQVWTILDQSSLPLLQFKSFISLDVTSSSKISNYPVEENSFATYNKTVSPNALNVMLALVGSDGELQNALTILETLTKTTQKVSVVSPYIEYKWYSLEQYDYSNTQENGLGILMVDLKFVEIKEVTPAYTTSIRYPKNPDAASPVDRGKIQPQSRNSVAFDLDNKLKGMSHGYNSTFKTAEPKV